jgi:DNA-directed RNA polymerase specialized sigma24 family protein
MKQPQHHFPLSNNGTGTVSPAVPSTNEQEEIKHTIKLETSGRIPLETATMSFNNLSIRELLDYCLKMNDQAGWLEFDKKLRPTIYGSVRKKISSKNIKSGVEQELVQDTFMKLYAHDRRALRNLRWDNDESIFKYAKVVAHSAVQDWRTKNKIFDNIKGIDDHGTSFLAGKQTENLEILRGQIDRCLQALASNPDFGRDRAIFWYFFRWGYHASEIAVLPGVNLSVRKVENILQKLVGFVRSRLANDHGKSAPPE